MRWLFVLDTEVLGGTELQLAMLFPLLEKSGVDVILACPNQKVFNHFQQGIKKRVLLANTLAEWEALIDSYQIEGVFLTRGQLGPIAQATKRKKRKLCWISGYVDHDIARLPLWDEVIVCSNHLQKSYEALGLSNITLIPWGVDFQNCAESDSINLKAKLAVSKESVLIGYAARFAKYKRHKDLLYLIKKIPKSVGVFMGSGQGGESKLVWNELQSLSFDLGITGRIHYLSVLPGEIPSHLKSLDLYFSPAENEGLGISLIEALGCGVPVLASNSGGFKEILAKTPDSLFPLGNIEAATHILKENPPGPALAHQRDHIEQLFSLETVGDKFLKTMGVNA